MSDVMAAVMTVEEFMALPDDGRHLKLVCGELREVAPVFAPAAVVASNVMGALILHVHPGGLGRVLMDNATFVLLEHRHSARSPNVAFIRADRLPPDGFGPGAIRIPPDLAVEVLSPSETVSILEDKLADYREAKTPLIWVVDPETRLVVVHPADAPSYTLREGATLTGDRVLPDFRCAVADLFEGVARA